MDPLFPGASAGLLRSLADAFRSGRLGPAASRLTITRVTPCPDIVVAGVTRLLSEGMAPAHLALLLDAHADAIEARTAVSGSIELVWTGPETAASYSRDTSVVVRELFQSAQRSVLVSTFVMQRVSTVFESLAKRMEKIPELRVQLFVHVGRKERDTRLDSEILREFTARMLKEWPGRVRPLVYYDPRSLSADQDTCASWHAKVVVIDEAVSLVTSANFTQRAQERNVEAGVLIRDERFARQLRRQFEGLVETKAVREVPGFGGR